MLRSFHTVIDSNNLVISIVVAVLIVTTRSTYVHFVCLNQNHKQTNILFLYNDGGDDAEYGKKEN